MDAYNPYYFNSYENYMPSVSNNFAQNSFNTNQRPLRPVTQMPQNQMIAAPSDERIWVQGKNAAEAYLVAPNGFVRLWDVNSNTFYEKSADASGRPSIKTFTYSEMTESTSQESSKNQNKDDINDLVLDELNKLTKRVDALEERKKA